MKKSRDSRRERRQSNKSHWIGRTLSYRRWCLRLLLVMAPFLTKVVELAILILKSLK